MAVLAFILALGGAAIAWAPFVFVLGGAAGLAAIVLATIALRRTARAGQTKGSARRLAIAALCIGPVALGLCVVGVFLTKITYREFDDYANPGPYRVADEVCTLTDRTATYTGSIVNLDDRQRDYELFLQFLDGSEVVATDRVDVNDVAAGARGTWKSSGHLSTDADLTCRVR